jgi:hypothetical protein
MDSTLLIYACVATACSVLGFVALITIIDRALS